MKKYIILVALLFLCIIGCKEVVDKPNKDVTVVNVVHASLNAGSLKFSISNQNTDYNKITNPLIYGSNRVYYVESGKVNIGALTATANPAKEFLATSANLYKGLYTLYLIDNLAGVDTLFKQESAPFISNDLKAPLASDSVVNVRFINLSSNSPALKINIRNNATNEVENLGFKTFGAWKSYPNKLTATTTYIFEIRDANSNVILSTYSFGATSTNRFKNVSLILKGLVGTTTGANAFGVQVVNYF